MQQTRHHPRAQRHCSYYNYSVLITFFCLRRVPFNKNHTVPPVQVARDLICQFFGWFPPGVLIFAFAISRNIPNPGFLFNFN